MAINVLKTNTTHAIEYNFKSLTISHSVQHRFLAKFLIIVEQTA